MFDDQLRHAKESVFIQLAHLFNLFTLHPATITGIALVFGLLAALFLSQGHDFIGFMLWMLNRIFDGLDGTVARVQDLQSDLGGYLDILSDFLVYALIPAALVWANPTTPNIWGIIGLISIFYLNGASWMYLSALLEKRKLSNLNKKTSVDMPSGLIGGAETILFFSAFILLNQWLAVLFWIMSVMVVITIGQRLHWAVEHLD